MEFTPFLLTETFQNPAEEAGAYVGTVFATLGTLFGVVRCAQILRRPTTSTLCVTALLLVFIGWALSSSVRLFTLMTGYRSELLHIILSFVMVAILIGGLAVGIVGLCLYDASRYRQGKAQAIWAIVLSSVIVLSVGVGAAVNIASKIQHNDDDSSSLVDGGTPREIKNEQFNFSVTANDSWWEIPNPKQLNKLSCMALRLKNSEVFMVVIAEEAGIGIRLEDLSESVRIGALPNTKNSRQTQENVQMNGLDFVRIQTLTRPEGVFMNVYYDQWVVMHGGRCWQLLFWGAEQHEKKVQERATAMMSTFRVLNKDRILGEAVENRARPELGYATHLEPGAWNKWSNPAELTGLADFSAQRHLEAFVVVPLRFEEGAVSLDAAASALLSTINLEYPTNSEDQTSSEKSWIPPGAPSGGAASGLEIRQQLKHVDGTTYRYKVRVAHWPTGAVMVAGWVLEGKGDMKLVENAMSSVELHEPRGAAPPIGTPALNDYGTACNQIGLHHFQREEYPTSARWFKKGFEQTHSDPVMLENYAHALENAEQAAEAVEYLKPFSERFTEHLPLGVRRARLAVLTGKTEEAEKQFLGLLDQGLKNEDDLLAWIKLLVARDDYKTALHSGEAWLARRPSLNVRRWLAQTLFSSGDHKLALQKFEEILATDPANKRSAYDLAEYCNEAGEHNRAAEVAEKVLKEETESYRALMALGWSQMGRKWYKDAKLTFERVAQKNPKDSDVQGAIRSASAALGQGDNSDIKQLLPPVETPPEVLSALEGVKVPDAFEEGQSAVSLLRTTGYHYAKGKPSRRTLFRKVKVLDNQGAKDLSSMQFAFNPLAERIFMNRLEVRDGDGKLISQATVDDAYVRDLHDGTASSDRVLHLQVEGVKPGYIIECEVTIEDLSTARHFEFTRRLFANSAPIEREAVFITGETSGVKHHFAQGESAQTLRNDKFLAWVMPPQATTEVESYSVWGERRCPMLWIGGDEGDWAAVGKEYLQQIQDRLEASQDLKELAAKLVEGIKDPQARVAVLARHVQKEISYKAIEFGVRARRPNAGSDTIRSRYGDCKDHALLLHLLLKAADVPSHLALVNTDWETAPSLPSLDQFNHMVVHVPVLGKNWLLDPTDKTLSLSRYPAQVALRSGALILDPAGPRLISPKGSMPAGSGEMENRRTVSISERDWVVVDQLELNGYYASAIRESFSGLTPKEQQDQIQSILAQYGTIQVESFRFEALDDPDLPARLVTTYRVRDAISVTGTARQASLPSCWEDDYLATKYIKDRKSRFEFLYPLHFKSRLTWKIPAGLRAEAVKALAQKSDSKFTTWHLAPSVADDGTVTVDFDFQNRTGEFPASDYAEFHDAWEAARRSWTPPLQWEEAPAGKE
ncbi:tetratricopeptide repeat protein [Verrucomicrobium sp. BvORR106]|uniref:tetratricopeptide repeat protein n=1 Tax=Verrucomicrobium sp. BvORR106 TaxID=1403819 RepID=UPI000570BF49|nr:tetratricopeptide repeat protein [Verrucomicrobium sp. BvORR106]